MECAYDALLVCLTYVSQHTHKTYSASIKRLGLRRIFVM